MTSNVRIVPRRSDGRSSHALFPPNPLVGFPAFTYDPLTLTQRKRACPPSTVRSRAPHTHGDGICWPLLFAFFGSSYDTSIYIERSRHPNS